MIANLKSQGEILILLCPTLGLDCCTLCCEHIDVFCSGFNQGHLDNQTATATINHVMCEEYGTNNFIALLRTSVQYR